MSQTIEVSKESVIEFRRLHDEIAMLRGLIEAHNARLIRDCKVSGSSVCKSDLHKIAPCLRCPRRDCIDLPEPNHE